MKKMISTMSGMWALWDYEQYKNIDSFEGWENLFLNDSTILSQIDLATFVPINIHSDGLYQFEIKINEPLNERENKYILKKSEKYLLKTDGLVILSGIECISNNVRDDEILKVKLEKGFYSVYIYAILWDKEPNMRLDNGYASPDALPDFIICLDKVSDTNNIYRKSIDTFN